MKKLPRLLIFLCGVTACAGNDRSSELLVTNGQNIDESNYPEVVRIDLGGGLCTATFVSKRTIITAAHCIQGGQVAYRGIPAATMRAHPYTNYQVNGFDLAVVQWAQDIAPAVAELATVSPSPGQELTIVGYGHNNLYDSANGSGAGSKRVGRNQIRRVDDMIHFVGSSRTTSGDGSNASSGHGDSGGPLFVGGRLVGITSGGSSDGFNNYSLYVNLMSNSSQSFLQSARAAGFDIPVGQPAAAAAQQPNTQSFQDAGGYNNNGYQSAGSQYNNGGQPNSGSYGGSGASGYGNGYDGGYGFGWGGF